MKTLVLMLSFTFLGQVFAQGRFYFRPKFEARTFMGSTYMANKDKISIFNFDYTTFMPDNPYMDVKVKRQSFQNVYTMGLNMGYIFPSDNRVEFGWNQDATGNQFIMAGLSDQGDSVANTNYFAQRSTFHSLVLGHRFEFNYYQVFKQKAARNKLHWSCPFLTFGLGFKFSPNAFKKKEPVPANYPYFLAGGGEIGDEKYSWTHTVYAVNRFTPFFTFGFGCDLHYQEINLFSIQFTYTQGLELMEATDHYMSVYVQDVLTSTYIYKTYSRGSGFQLQISRRIQFYPKKKRE
ncbi:MAG: hypothetical protein IPM74_07415 [Crocinitomicaceae bacterium]|nr:hypothetical protein [Crocinitomicaceae bacterium]MBK8925728.1 hypothetical protein [Crocinitomicaceae bacterium]